MASNPGIVPMPIWSAPVGCTKLFLAIIILAFTAACTSIWGGYPAFGVSLFTASFSLITFGYYLTALSFKQTLYNKYVILVLESLLTVFWFVSLVLLAGWTGACGNFPYWVWDSSSHISPYDGIDLSKRDQMDDYLSIWHTTRVWKKRLGPPITPVRVHGHDAHQAARILAGISAGLASIAFILYALTLIIFSINLTKLNESQFYADADVESQPQPTTTRFHCSANRTSTILTLSTPTPPAITAPLRVNTLPKDFDEMPQSQEYYLNPEEATKAGIQPPTPVMKALMAEKEKRQSVETADLYGRIRISM